jgi:hypothetical protein
MVDCFRILADDEYVCELNPTSLQRKRVFDPWLSDGGFMGVRPAPVEDDPNPFDLIDIYRK